MSRLALRLKSQPLRLAGALWPLALLTPFVPGLPRPANGGFAWRQELAVASLLCLTFVLLVRRTASARAACALFKTPARLSPERLSSFLLAAFVAWAAASAAWATDLFAAAHYALSWVAYLLLFLLLARAYASGRILRAALYVLGAGVFVVSAANIVGHLGSTNSLLRQNGLGEPLAVSIPLFAALALCVRRRRVALLAGAASTLAWLAVLQIAERTSFIAVSAGLFVLVAAMLATRRFRPRTPLRAVVLGLAFVACLASQYAPTPFEQSAHRPVLARLGATSTDDVNARARFLYWGTAVEMWRAHPVAGVGAGNFSTKLPEARAAFAVRYPDSPLSRLNEKFLNTGAHNEYLQILAETGAAGLALFVAFGAALMWSAWRALRGSRGPLAPGAVASLAVFAVSSGASAVSFRWMGSGLVFFFAAALVTRLSAQAAAGESRPVEDAATSAEGTEHDGLRGRRRFDALPLPAPAFGLALSMLLALVMGVHAAGVQFIAEAQRSGDEKRTEALYRTSLALNPLNPATHYQFGVWLFHRGRDGEAVPHLRYSVERGFNASTCYAYLAGAESNAGGVETSERTLAEAVRVFPRSVFLRARHAAALARLGRDAEAELEMAAALLLDSRAARGWRSLIDEDIDAATAAALRDPKSAAVPGELEPEDAVFAVLKENERRFPWAVHTGWRARMRSN
ncbi:MAG: O-antigen ligase family protein [Pyrinomonadaceae bacterium]